MRAHQFATKLAGTVDAHSCHPPVCVAEREGGVADSETVSPYWLHTENGAQPSMAPEAQRCCIDSNIPYRVSQRFAAVLGTRPILSIPCTDSVPKMVVRARQRRKSSSTTYKAA